MAATSGPRRHSATTSLKEPLARHPATQWHRLQETGGQVLGEPCAGPWDELPPRGARGSATGGHGDHPGPGPDDIASGGPSSSDREVNCVTCWAAGGEKRRRRDSLRLKVTRQRSDRRLTRAASVRRPGRGRAPGPSGCGAERPDAPTSPVVRGRRGPRWQRGARPALRAPAAGAATPGKQRGGDENGSHGARRAGEGPGTEGGGAWRGRDGRALEGRRPCTLGPPSGTQLVGGPRGPSQPWALAARGWVPAPPHRSPARLLRGAPSASPRASVCAPGHGHAAEGAGELPPQVGHEGGVCVSGPRARPRPRHSRTFGRLTGRSPARGASRGEPGRVLPLVR